MNTSLPVATRALDTSVEVPGSKSETNRALVMAALAETPSVVTGALDSRDSDLMLAALRALGVGIDDHGGGELHVTPPASFQAPVESIDCGLAGTVMRFVPPLALLIEGTTSFHGDPHASQRPMAGLLDGLRQLGAQVSADQLPFSITGSPSPAMGAVVVDSSLSSQFVSGLLLVGPRLPRGLQVRHEGASVPSRPHIDMTVQMLRDRGVTVHDVDEVTWRVEPGSIRGLDTRIEPDLTNASVFLAAAMLAGGTVHVPGWPETSIQPGVLFLDVARRMGARVERRDDGVSLTGTGRLQAIDVDLHAASELTCVVASLAALAEGTSTIRGVAHIRGHETDRLKALATELSRLGVEVTETEDGLRIVGRPEVAGLDGFETYADHRMVHAAALLGLRSPGISVTDMECVSKTMPNFPRLWNELIGR